MGDGWVGRNSKNSAMYCEMITDNYLHYLDREFDTFSRGVKFVMSAEENAKKNRDSGFSVDADSSNYSDLYRWSTMCHPDINTFNEWYSSGQKVFPDDLNLSPTILKHWYVCDGYYDDRNSRSNIVISMSNESDNKENIEEIFSSSQLPQPYWDESERESGGIRCSARWNKTDSSSLFEYMGDPLPGFEYKWLRMER